MKVYIFADEATAEAFKMTAYHFGHEGRRIGSALVLSEEAYTEVLDKTYAIPAALIADAPAKYGA